MPKLLVREDTVIELSIIEASAIGILEEKDILYHPILYCYLDLLF